MGFVSRFVFAHMLEPDGQIVGAPLPYNEVRKKRRVTTYDVYALTEFVRPTDKCFFCGEELGTYHLVYWNGFYPPQIWLHAECALAFSRHLKRDVKRLHQELIEEVKDELREIRANHSPETDNQAGPAPRRGP